MSLLYLLIFFVGISFGSFLNVLIDRIPQDLPLFLSRSFCEKCKKTLSWYDLIPVVSYLALFGKCRYCKTRIPKRIFLVEVLTGLLFISVFSTLLFHQSILSMVLLLAIICSFFVIFFIDLEQGIIPDKILIFLTGVLLLYHILLHSFELPYYLIAGIAALLFFLLIVLITKGKGMGLGDVKFAFVIGLFLGFPNTVVALYMSFLTGALISLILILLGRKKLRGDTIPFGPFLVLGTLIAYVFGEKLSQLFLFL